MIPARGGSKRLPGKNILPLGGKPLIVWSIDVAKNIPEICDILVSTDDEGIAVVSKNAGAFVPWLRPARIATDTTSSVDVALHALSWYEAEKGLVDGILLLQPTSPFRTQDTLKRGIGLFRQHNRLPVLGVSPAEQHPMWTLRIKGDSLAPFIENHGLEKRSQDLPPAFFVNGSFYLLTPEDLRTNNSFLSTNTVPLEMHIPQEYLDIDTEWDYKIAKLMLKGENDD